MSNSQPFRSRTAFSLVEMLVVIVIIAIVIALLVSGVQRVREAANRAMCVNNLKEIGVGINSFHQLKGCYPNECYNRSFFTDILPYMGEENLYRQVMLRGPGAAQPVPYFLCPSRRSKAVGARTDYASGVSSGMVCKPGEFQTILEGVVWPDERNNYPGQPRPNPVRQADVLDGLASTLLLAHKAMKPSEYNPRAAYDTPQGTISDQGWATPYIDANTPCGAVPRVITPLIWAGWSYDHFRSPYGFGKDADVPTDPLIDPVWWWPEFHRLMTSPHRDVMPCVFADGSVRMVRLYTNNNIIASLWFIADGQAANVPGPLEN
jgi:prepilin-type N-terminal cleavage/methylation domain-containing protein